MTTPTATHGFIDKVPGIMASLNAKRSHKDHPRNITLRQHMQEEFNLEVEHLYAELGIDPQTTTVQELYGMKNDVKHLMPEIITDGMRRGMGIAQRESLQAMREGLVSQSPILSEGAGGQRWITPEVFQDPVMRGAVQSVFYPDLVVREVMIAQPQTTLPHFDLSDASMQDSEEGATIGEGSVTYGSKDVKVKTRTQGIKMTYDAIRFNTLDLASIFFMDVGRLLGNKLNSDCVNVIINGDQADLSEQAAVIGVKDTGAGFQYFDILRVWVRLSLLGRQSTSIIGNELTALDYLELPEVKNKQFTGSPLLRTTLKTPLPTDQDLYVSTKVPANQLVFQDSSLTIVQLTAQPLMVESDKIISKRIAETVASIMTGFANLQRNSRVVLDKSQAYAGGYVFPAWMSPFSE
jgi:hypothetical protein